MSGSKYFGYPALPGLPEWSGLDEGSQRYYAGRGEVLEDIKVQTAQIYGILSVSK